MVKKSHSPHSHHGTSTSGLHRRGSSRKYDDVDDRITIPLATPPAAVRSVDSTTDVLRSGIDKYRSLNGGRTAAAAAAGAAPASTTSTSASISTLHSSFKHGMVAAVRGTSAMAPQESPAERAARLVEQRLFTAAMPLWTEALNAASGSAQTKIKLFYQRGSCALSAQQYEGAILDFTQVVELTPPNAMLLAKRAKAFAALHKHNEALQDYSEAIALSTSGSSNAAELRALYIARAKVFRAMNNLRGAMEDYARAEATPGGDRDAGLFLQRARLRVQRCCGD
ncbi:hypothetical protein P43SY_005390 [Pythium insidiosum]|uniref:Uncharacterized protein n=1 Tax=Pythium insidiosum TaxID=114742 RepID=A0AAD5Q7A7_PYTIN|nr:hypothetical protein P43SY_005390 [Pythium insidiosum]KAJ0398105.1 hypothetical protein ATCC90586_000292 [Pythium insidiosum]